MRRSKEIRRKRNAGPLPALLAALIAMMPGFCGAAPIISLYNQVIIAPPFAVAGTTPRENERVEGSPPQVAVNFTGTVASGSLRLYDPYNNAVASGDDLQGDNRLTLIVPASLYSGVYRVEWSALCDCAAHVTLKGTFRFAVQ